MVAKKSVVSPMFAPAHRKQLELLYARRIAIDTLMRSLTDYDRFREKTLDLRKLKTA